MFMGMLVHMSARVVSNDLCFSGPAMPKSGTLAGCTQSVPWTRIHLYDMLDNSHKSYRPTTVQSWVDDLAQQVVGSRQSVINSTVGAATFFGQQLD